VRLRPDRPPLLSAAQLVAAGAGAVVLLVWAAAGPAAARPWPEDPSPASTTATRDRAPGAEARTPAALPLSRVGAQFVRGDNLTGAGVAAPDWIPGLKEGA
jgi:hypothetical protein